MDTANPLYYDMIILIIIIIILEYVCKITDHFKIITPFVKYRLLLYNNCTMSN